jgi:hypothetical protein
MFDTASAQGYWFACSSIEPSVVIGFSYPDPTILIFSTQDKLEKALLALNPPRAFISQIGNTERFFDVIRESRYGIVVDWNPDTGEGILLTLFRTPLRHRVSTKPYLHIIKENN